MAPTTAEVMELRRAAGFVTPLKPLEPGEVLVLFDQVGLVEWLSHPDDAARYLEEGVVVDGKLLVAVKVDEAPMLNGIQLRAQDGRERAFAAGGVFA